MKRKPWSWLMRTWLGVLALIVVVRSCTRPSSTSLTMAGDSLVVLGLCFFFWDTFEIDGAERKGRRWLYPLGLSLALGGVALNLAAD